MIRLISKFVTSEPGKQRIAIHILPNISRRKGNQTMKFGQLIEYKVGNIFLEKSYAKYGGESFPITLFVLFVFIVCQVEDYRNILKLSCRPLALTSCKASLKNKKRSGTIVPASFSA